MPQIATYDEEGRLVMPCFSVIDFRPEATSDVMECFKSCICTSRTLFHLRWGFFDESPSEDDHETLCERQRGKDLDGFWHEKTICCMDCWKIFEDIKENCW